MWSLLRDVEVFFSSVAVRFCLDFVLPKEHFLSTLL